MTDHDKDAEIARLQAALAEKDAVLAEALRQRKGLEIGIRGREIRIRQLTTDTDQSKAACAR